MIGQRSEALSQRGNIHPYGCYFMSIIMMCWEYSKDPAMSVESQEIIKAYDTLVKADAMGDDCYIKNAQKCVDFWGKDKLLFTGKNLQTTS